LYQYAVDGVLPSDFKVSNAMNDNGNVLKKLNTWRARMILEHGDVRMDADARLPLTRPAGRSGDEEDEDNEEK
jgi:hypothetical protein